jgi:alpha-tubulin suppressor-like RCC1 family protein
MSILSDVVSIVSGAQHTCALTAQGVLSCWGLGDVGQLGRPGGGDPATPGPVDVQWPTGTYVVSAATGSSHTCALISDGSVYCWGWNTFGQLGNATNVGAYDPTPPNPTPAKVDFAWPQPPVALAAGFAHTCALLSDGTVYCWGSDILSTPPSGTGEPGNSIVPLQVFADDRPFGKVVEIAGTGISTCALLQDGTAACWGVLGSSGRNEVPQPVHDVDGISTLSGIVAMAGTGLGDTTCFLVKDKRVVCWGADLQGSFASEVPQGSVPFASPKAIQF